MSFDLEAYVRRDMQSRPVRLSDNALLVNDNVDLFTEVWFGLRQFESELYYQEIWA